MPAINPVFVQKLYELTAFAYQNGVVCPPLEALNQWTLAQLAATGASTAGIPTRAANDATSGRRGTNGAGNFDDAVLAAIASSPNGVENADMRPILAQYRRTASQIGAALSRLAKAGKIEKKGERWRLKRAGGGTVDRSIGTRRRNTRTATPARATRTASATAGATGTAAEAQPQAASA